MATVGISEFTFGYAFLYEQTHRKWANLTAAPILPSLYREAALGWDAHLPLEGTDFYYQFKLSDYLSHGNSTYIRNRTYGSPYYRIALHRRDRNRQHRRLKWHAAKHPNTFYVAPEFSDLRQFNSEFLNRQITNASRLIPVSECDHIWDGDQHYITFQQGDQEWMQHTSESARHPHSVRGENLGELYEGSSPQWRPVDRSLVSQLFLDIRGDVFELLDDEEDEEPTRLHELLDLHLDAEETSEILDRASQVLSVFFGLTLTIVGTPRQRQ